MPPQGPWGPPPHQQQQPWGQPQEPYGKSSNPYAPPGPPAPMMSPYAPPMAYGNPYIQQSASSTAAWAVGLAIASWIMCGILTSLPALFMARAELAAINRGESPEAGRSYAQAAFWLSVTNVGLTVIVVAAIVLLFMIGMSVG
jgi:hypothetical protein